MAYTSNPNIPQLRMKAVLMVRRGASTHQVARYFGYNQSTVARWVQRAPFDGRESIPTPSSKPKSHPRSLDAKIVKAIVEERLKHGRCAEVIHATLTQRGIKVSLSSVKLTSSIHHCCKGNLRLLSQVWLSKLNLQRHLRHPYLLS